MKFSPFVTAAQLAASGLASAAAALGWSSPILTNPATRMYVDNFPGGANVERGEMGQMLTLFRSQTLALDVPCGTDFDETNIEWMAGIESLLDTFTWHYNHTPFTIEWTSIIHPQAVVPIIGATNWIIQPTAAGYATAPFAYWRAKKAYFKFQVVCNGLTSGKFAILVDPNVAQYTIITSNIDLNKQHSVLVDLQETQEVTVCIDLLGMNTRPWLNNVDYPTKVQGVGTIVSPTSWIDAAAGFVMFVPITEIQSPDSIDLQVNVFTWFEGMQVNFLTSQYLPATRVMTQMHQSGPEDVKTPCVQLNETTPDPRGLCEHYFGEQPITFGSLLKRYVTTYYNSITPLITDTWIRATLPIYPPIKPLFNSGTADARTYDLLSYLRYAYVGMRGGMTKRLSLVGDYVVRQTRVTLSAPATSTAATSLTSGNNSAPISVLEGTAVFDSGSGGSTIVGIPFYSNNLFLLSGNDTPYDTSDTNQSNYCSRNYTVDFQIDPRTTNARFLTEDTIPSEDFRLCYFLAAVPYAHVKV